MALNKVTYVDNVTVIGAENLNAIQDAIIENTASIGTLSDLTTESKTDLVSAINEAAESGGSSVPSNVRQAMLTLFESAAYAETGLTDEIAVIESWASEVTSLSLSAETLSLNADTPQTLVATVVPSSATVTWSSSDATIATVVSGVVTGVSNGTCTITASAGDISATCAVTVSGFATLESISAVYTQSGTVYDTDSLDSLKADLVVTAHYDNGTTQTVTAYTLSGALTEGTSTITVSYGGQTDSFTVTVTIGVPSGYTKYDYLTKGENKKDAVNTGLLPNPSGSIWDVDFEFSTTNDSGVNEQGFGARSTSSGTATGNWAWFFADTSKTFAVRCQAYGSNYTTEAGTFASDAVHHISWRYNNGSPTISVDGESPVGVTKPSTVTPNTTLPVYLCGLNNGDTAGTAQSLASTGKTKWGRVTIYEAGTDTKLYDFLPAYNGTKYGYYEKVNDVFYPSINNYITGGNY